MKIYTTKTFEASHKLEGMEKCGNLHGHTYRAEVWIEYNYCKKVFDFSIIKGTIEELDHKYLNDIISYPTAENIATYLIATIKKENPNFNSIRIRIWEGLDNYAEDELKMTKNKKLDNYIERGD